MLRASCLLLVVLPGTTVAQLTIDPPVARLGEVLGGPPQRRAVLLRNEGTGGIEILDIERGCSCLEATPAKRTLGPGDTTTLAVEVRTLGHKEGPYLWNATLHYRRGSRMETATLRIEATIRNEVSVEPSELRLQVAEPLRHDILVRDRREAPFPAPRVTTALKGVRLECRREEPGLFRVTVITDPTLPAEKQRGAIQIITSDPFYACMTVPLEIERVEPAAIQAIPERIRLAPAAGIRSALVRLRGKEDGLKIERVEAAAGLACSWAENPTGGAILRVRAEAAAPAAVSVRVIFAAGKAELRIPIDWGE